MPRSPGKRRLLQPAAERRETASARGYGHQWQQAAKAYLAEHPLCVECLFSDKVQPARAVDHIIPHRGNDQLFWDGSNWCGLCGHHHGIKTVKERQLATWEPRRDRVVVCGLPASGKTTYARGVAEQLGCDYWDWDEVSIKTGMGRVHQMREGELDKMFAIRASWIEKRGNDPLVMIVGRPLSAMHLAEKVRSSVHHCIVDENTRGEMLRART